MTPFKVVIPARHAATRLPGKPLLDIAGKPMVVRVAERASRSGAEEICVATDHAEIADEVRRHGFDAVMTRAEHVSGTDRIAEVARLKRWPEDAVIVNVQGDEPLIEPALIQEVASDLVAHDSAAMATACHRIDDAATLLNPNAVKVVFDKEGYALYFSRAPIPFMRDGLPAGQLPETLPAYRHIGIYAYRAGFLALYGALPPAQIETCESLEQLRVIWHGYRISVAITANAPAAGVDTAADLAKVREIFASGVDSHSAALL